MAEGPREKREHRRPRRKGPGDCARHSETRPPRLANERGPSRARSCQRLAVDFPPPGPEATHCHRVTATKPATEIPRHVRGRAPALEAGPRPGGRAAPRPRQPGRGRLAVETGRTLPSANGRQRESDGGRRPRRGVANASPRPRRPSRARCRAPSAWPPTAPTEAVARPIPSAATLGQARFRQLFRNVVKLKGVGPLSLPLETETGLSNL